MTIINSGTPVSNRPVLGVVLTYAVFAGLWILFSDTVALWLFEDATQIALVSATKGWLFVAVTSALLFTLLNGWRESLGGTNQALAHEKKALPKPIGLMILFVALALVAPLGGAVFFAVRMPHIESEVLTSVQAIARLKAEHVENWLKERDGDASVLMVDLNLATQAGAFAQNQTDVAQRRRMQALLDAIGTAYGVADKYTGMMLLDVDGNVLLGHGEHLESTPRMRDLALLATSSKRMQRGELFRGERNDIHMDWVAPLLVSDQKGARVAGSVVLRIDAAKFLHPLIQSWPAISASAECLLIRRDGNSVVFLSPLRHRDGAAMSLRVPIDSPNMIGVTAITAKRPGNLRGVDYRGIEVLAAHSPIAGTDWHLIAKMDRREALAPLWRAIYAIGFVTFAAAAAIMLTLLLLWREQQRVQTLALQGVRSASDRLIGAIVDASSDAIFAKDLEGRYLLVNRETTRITGKSVEQIIGRDDAALIPRQAEALRANDRRVISENRVIECEETLDTTYGTRTYLATKGPLRDADGHVIGLFGVSRDISALKKDALALQEKADALQCSNQELERFNRAAVGRELDMIDLKRQVNALSRQLGRPEPFAIDFAGTP